MSIIHVCSEVSGSVITRLSGSGIRSGDKQPNAVDVRIDKVFSLTGGFTLTEDCKSHRTAQQMPVDADGMYNLAPGSYDITMDVSVEIAEGECGWVVPRSTLNRNGLFITSGIYDSGYNGVIGSCLHVPGGCVARIGRGTRVGQFILATAETLHLYDGDYGHGKVHDSKYK